MISRELIYFECEKLKQHNSLEHFYSHFKSFADQLGFYQLLYTVLPSFYVQDLDKLPPVFITTYNTDWMEYYTDKRYDLDDHALKYCLSGNESPYLWPRSDTIGQLSRKEEKVFLEAGEVGIQQGITLPMYNGFGALGVMSLSFKGSEQEFDHFYASRKEAIEIFAYSFNETILSRAATHFGSPHRPNLTPKEKEVLKWLAAGYSYNQISDRLTVGVSTIRKQTSSVMKKLQARNSTHACALALRWGLVA